MKPAKTDYYDPKLKGKQDGNDMDELPRIISPPQKKPPEPPRSASSQSSSDNQVRKSPASQVIPPSTKIDKPEKDRSTMHASNIASTLASKHDNLLEEVRQVVKLQGKEVSYVRLTQAEKNLLADIIYSYKRQGIRTSETEVNRIAINYLLEDYQANGKTSILARMLEILKS